MNLTNYPKETQGPDAEHWQQLEANIARESHFLDVLISELKQKVIGQDQLLERLVISLLGNGHILLEGMPGLEKTLAVKTLAQAVNALFSRIQFTPDLLPADILGTMIYNIQTNEFTIKKGPVFSNFVLADEINRAPEKVQSALLEVMQEHQVTIGNTTYPLGAPFMVLATQNPIEQSGTYELPEAQLDRFMLKVIVGYPAKADEKLINRNAATIAAGISPAIDQSHILKMQRLIPQIYVDEKLEDYILDLILCTRSPDSYGLEQLQPYIKFGASPRGGINLTIAARARAFLKKRAYVLPEDVVAIAPDVLRHRIGLNYAAVAEGVTADRVLEEIIKSVPSP
jgi:MoxR-like ATPase